MSLFPGIADIDAVSLLVYLVACLFPTSATVCVEQLAGYSLRISAKGSHCQLTAVLQTAAAHAEIDAALDAVSLLHLQTDEKLSKCSIWALGSMLKPDERTGGHVGTDRERVRP